MYIVWDQIFIRLPVVTNLEHRAPFGVSVITLIQTHGRTLWTSNQPVVEISTYTGQQNRQTSMPPAGFEPATTATKRPQTYALDRAATEIGGNKYSEPIYCITFQYSFSATLYRIRKLHFEFPITLLHNMCKCLPINCHYIKSKQ
jgi:hypothetical protein